MKILESQLKQAHKCSYKNKELINSAKRCYCFYCLHVFAPFEVKEWVNGEDTALCPKCGIDSIITDNCGPYVDTQFLKEMRGYWFDSGPRLKITDLEAD